MPTGRPDPLTITTGSGRYSGIAGPTSVQASLILSWAVGVATQATITLPATGTTGASTAGTISLNGVAPAGGVTVTPAGAGATWTPASVSWAEGESGAAKAISIQRAAEGSTDYSISNNRGLTNLGAGTYTSSAASSTGTPSPFTLTSATSGTLPFTVGHAFRQGDIPAGSGIAISGATAQATIKNTWPDGSAKFAIIAGSYTSAGSAITITPSAGTSSTGTALTTADLIATGATASIDAGAFGAASFGNTEWGSPFQSWVSGHRMSSWIYRKQIGADAHLVAWLEVRLYLGGAVEVLPWVENGYLKVASPINKSATYSFTLGGTVRNGGGAGSAIDLKHHQRTPLVSGAALSYWLATDPGVTVKHDSAYLMATELVPTYWAAVSPAASLVTSLPSTFTPLQAWVYNYSSDSMASSGYQNAIGLLPLHDVLHLTTTADTYASIVREGYSAGRWGIHYRDENTNKPVRFQDRPNLVLADSQGFKDNGGSTTGDRSVAATGGNPPQWDTAHSPSVGYLAYLITGRFYFMEEVQFAATCNFLGNGDNAALRNGVQGLVQTAVDAWQTRSCAWDWRSKIQALTVTPDSGAGSEIRADLINCVEANIAHFHGRYVAQANNPFGLILPGEQYNTGGGASLNDVAIWQQDFVTAAFGWSVSLNLPIGSTPKSNLAAFFQWKAKSALITLGAPATATEWPYYNSAPYTVKIGTAIGTSSFTAGTGPWQADTGAMLAATTGGLGAPTWFASNDGLLTFEFQPNADEACKGVFANRLPALAYAVRHGVPGAVESYRRLIGATNWAQIENAFDARPVWGVKPASGDLPAWLVGMAVNEIKNLSTTADTQGAALNAWGSLPLIDGTATLVSPANGGHNDSSDNRVTSLDLTQASPAWTVQIAPSVSVTANAAHNPDGKPGSRHVYHHAHYVSQRQRIMLFGQRGRFSDGGDNFKVDGHTVSGTWAWDAADTWAATAGFQGFGVVRDPTTGNVFANGGYKWTQSTNTWSALPSYTGGLRWPVVYDSKRDQFFGLQWADGQGFGSGLVAQKWNKTTGTGTAITFNASAAYTQWLADQPVYAGMDYDPINDCFLFYTGQSYSSGSVTANVPTRIYKITPNSGAVWDMSLLTVTGNTPANVVAGGAGINGRWRYIPALGGFYCQPAAGVAGWFLRTS